MNGTTLCPHCETRFRITDAQLTAHRGMVRCGHCLQPFDARTSYIPETQLILPIDDEPEEEFLPDEALGNPHRTADILQGDPDLHEPPQHAASATVADTTVFHPSLTDIPAHAESDNTLDFSRLTEHSDRPLASEVHGEEKFYHADLEADAVQSDISSFAAPVKRRNGKWIAGALLAILFLTAQSAYFFRVSLAVRLPALKPALVGYCQLLNCSVPLPENADLMSIESSSLDADPAHDNQITLNALLRSHGGYALSFPSLVLTLNDGNDKPLARRLFAPSDYLPSEENASAGFAPNHEVNVKLRMDTGDIKATGYRLELLYPH